MAAFFCVAPFFFDQVLPVRSCRLFDSRNVRGLFIGFQFREQDIEAFHTLLVACLRGQAPIVLHLSVDLFAFPAHRRLRQI